MQAPSLRRCTCFEWLWSRLSLYVACYDSGHQVTSDHGRKAVTSAKCQKTIQYVLTSNQKHQKQAQWMKQAKKINTFFWDFYRQDSWGLQMTPGLVSWLNWIRSGAGTHATEGGRSEGIFDSVWKRVFSYFLHRKARLWLSSAKSIIFFRRWIGFTCLKQNSRIFSCFDFHRQSTLVPHCVFPECVARVPVSLWGSGGWGCVRSTLRSRSQPFATVRNRSCEDRMAVPMGSSAEVVIFGGFRRVVASFRVAGVALCDIQTCFATCWKSFCVAGAILLWRFQKMYCSFRGRRITLDVSIVIFRGRRSTLDVSCCVFFANRIGRAASSGDKVQIPWQAWHFLTCAENWRKPRTKHRFWGCKFSGSKENS